MKETRSKKDSASDAKTILCLLSLGVNHPIEARISRGLDRMIRARGYQPVFGVAPIDPRHEMRRLVEAHGDQLAGIAIQPQRPNRELAEVLLTAPVKNIPHILIGHYYDDILLSSCVVDNFGGMYAATEHLIRCGRRRLVYLGEVSLSSTENERYLGFCHACLHNGLAVPKDHTVNVHFEADLRSRFVKLFQGPEPPDGIVCLFDSIAPVALRVLAELGIRVPDDAAVISFGDDEDLADACKPPLSTAHHPAVAMGAVAAQQLIGEIEGTIPPVPSIYVVPVAMHIRESSGTPAALLPDGKRFWEVPFSEYIGVETRLAEPLDLG